VAIPSWALGSVVQVWLLFHCGEPRNLEEKIEDVGLLHVESVSGAITAYSMGYPSDNPR
jgi:L-rhamnose isomerase/sugar isomerase